MMFFLPPSCLKIKASFLAAQHNLSDLPFAFAVLFFIFKDFVVKNDSFLLGERAEPQRPFPYAKSKLPRDNVVPLLKFL